uniref:Beta-lactamase-related domain-containing protein n=1 Tax=Thermosporothrix sp. COM3 TaxID=2490863 RepID=A0A455SSH3_9CHLR|nr:hypothetical protein KTC_28550 [Thermosporothrix sp. COM3]
MPWVGPASFGHSGSGGSVAYGDPDAGVGIGYVTNPWSFRVGKPRAASLAEAVKTCLPVTVTAPDTQISLDPFWPIVMLAGTERLSDLTND